MIPTPSYITGNHSNVAISTNSVYLHHAISGYSSPVLRVLGPSLRIRLPENCDMGAAREYGCLTEDKGITSHAGY